MEKTERLLSLDVFRGLTIAGMILVNNPGSGQSVYPALRHAKWHGVTPTDLIFPFFLFIVGITTTISLSKRKERGDDQKKLIMQIIKRAAILFLLGLIMASFPFYNYDFSHIRIPGVLQRIGVVYLISSILFLKTGMKTQAIIAGSLLFIYWALMTLVPVPGIGYANLEPATNLGAFIDNMLLGGHLWGASKVWDPEGILSTIPAISTCLLGILTGYWLKSQADKTTKAVWMFIWGNCGLVLGAIWDMWFPINKSIWTSSYVLYSAGMALEFLAMCYYLIDVKGYNWWTKPFVVYGTNAITVYFLSGIVAKLLYTIKFNDSFGKLITLKAAIYNSMFAWWLQPINASLLWALSYCLFWLAMMWILYSKRIFIKI
ncbi:MAG: acyltransferase family protein [Bacillota bacterium]